MVVLMVLAVLSLTGTLLAESVSEVVSVLRVLPQQSDLSPAQSDSPESYEIRRRTVATLLEKHCGRDGTLTTEKLSHLKLFESKSHHSQISGKLEGSLIVSEAWRLRRHTFHQYDTAVGNAAGILP
jgi:hypothetical protein